MARPLPAFGYAVKPGRKPVGHKGQVTTVAAMTRGGKRTAAVEEAGAVAEAAGEKKKTKDQRDYRARKVNAKSATISQLLEGLRPTDEQAGRVELAAKSTTAIADAAALLQAAVMVLTRPAKKGQVDRALLARELRGLSRQACVIAELAQQQTAVLPEKVTFYLDFGEAQPLTCGDLLETA